MRYPKLRPIQTTQKVVDVFSGYDHNLRINEGAFYEMENISSDNYPILSTRAKRQIGNTKDRVVALAANNGLCVITTDSIVLPENDFSLPRDVHAQYMEKAETPCISIGGYLAVFPDKTWFNVAKIMEIRKEMMPGIEPDAKLEGNYGDIEASFSSGPSGVTISICTLEGSDVTAPIEEPSNPNNGDFWMDTTGETPQLKKWSSNSHQWVTQINTYVKIASSGIGEKFSDEDGVRIRLNMGETDANPLKNLGEISADGYVKISTVIKKRDTDYIVIGGIITNNTTAFVVELERRMPKMDFIAECGNRLWGCRYGLNNDGDTVNEIYCSKLGDFKNWEVYQGISTDSYAVSLGSDGPFTGATTYMGHPVFFKDNRIIRVLGDYPANFTIQEDICEGVQSGCHKSVAVIDGVMFYKGRTGVHAYDGALPVPVSYALGKKRYCDAVGYGHDGKYYISMKEAEGGEYHLFTYDVAKQIWCREDYLAVCQFLSYEGTLFAVLQDGGVVALQSFGSIAPLPIDVVWDKESHVAWHVESGPIGLTSPNQSRISRIILRLQLEEGATLSGYGQYDYEEIWKPLFNLTGTHLRSFSIPVRPDRCDTMKLRLEGTGNARIYSITYHIEPGSDIT